MAASELSSLVGNTPLIPIRRAVAVPAGREIFAKAEWFNAGGSVKDRAALAILAEGERSGALTKEKIILDATSGNTGIAYAWIAASRGYRLRLCLPSSASEERKRILKAYGAELVMTDPLQGSNGAIVEARKLFAEDPARYFYADQYRNDANWKAHYATTGNEIWEQTAGRVTHFVAGLGTSGTFVGTGRRLRELSPKIRLISFQPDSGFHGLEGLKHMPTAIVPTIYDPALADENLWIETEISQEVTRRLARAEGLLVGVSSGAALVASQKVAESAPEGSVIVTVFPDSGDKYLSLKFWDAA